MTAEEWRPVPGFPGYMVSDLGRVLSEHKWRGGTEPRILRGSKSMYGYPMVQLAGGTGSRNRAARSVHGLVALAFLGPRPEGQEVRHLDGDQGNPRLSNLCYGTHAENERDKVRHGTDPGSRTHCINGHQFDAVNTHRDPKTSRRYCRPCTRVNSRRYRARRALAAANVRAA